MSIKQSILVGLFTIMVAITYAAPPPPPGSGPPCWPPPCMPIDGGITFLMAAGVAFAAKKMIDYRKKENPSD